MGLSCGKNGSDHLQEKSLSDKLSLSDTQGLWALSVSLLSIVISLLRVGVFSVWFLFVTSSSELPLEDLRASKYSTSCCCGIRLEVVAIFIT